MGILGKKKTAKADAKEKKPVAKKPADKKADAPKKADEKKAAAPKREVNEKRTDAYRIISEPVFTEKADRQQAKGKYTFYVDTGANKVQVSEAVKVLYGVDPVHVRIINVKGKRVRFGRTMGKRKDRKKAVVTLKSGDSIAVME